MVKVLAMYVILFLLSIHIDELLDVLPSGDWIIISSVSFV